MNRSPLDTGIRSEIGKAIDPVVARNAVAYRQAFGRYTFSTGRVREVMLGFQKRQGIRRLRGFVTSLPSMEVLPVEEAATDLAG